MSLSLEFAVILSCLSIFIACGAAVFAYTLTRGMVSLREVGEVRASLEAMNERITSQQRELHLLREGMGRIENYLLHEKGRG